MVGHVDADGVPGLLLTIAGRDWKSVVDTGFNGDLELPDGLRPDVNARLVGQSLSQLAGGQLTVEDVFLVDYPFDGRVVAAEATFAAGDEILVGTHLIREY